MGMEGCQMKKLMKFSELWDSYETSIFHYNKIEEKILANEEIKEDDSQLSDIK